MRRIWSEEGKLARWFDVELAALDAWTELGVVPAADVAAIRDGASPPTPKRVAEIEQTTDHDLAAFVDAVAEQVGPEGRWFHYGLTSSDVVDTALALQIRDAGALIVEGIDAALAAVVRLAEAHRNPDAVAEYARTARERGIRVLIAGAGLAAALPGAVAAHTDLPVIGVPLRSRLSVLDGLDALLAIAQMPPGVPVATVGVDNAKNAAALAARILGS